MARFIVLALPLLLLLMAGFGFAADQLGAGAAPAPPAALTLAGWLVEAAALIALFLLIQGRAGRWWLDGVLTGALAWVFRAPLLVATVASVSPAPVAPLASWARGALLLELACGLLLAGLARVLKVER